MLGYPDAALADAERALKAAREIGHAATLLYALSFVPTIYVECGNYATAKAVADEGCKLASEKSALFWGAQGMLNQGSILLLTGQTTEAVQMLTDGLADSRQARSIMMFEAAHLAFLARACAELGQSDNAWRCIDEALTAIEKSKERVWESNIHRLAGEIALKSPQPDAAKAKEYFERALAVARKQQAKSLELRAAMSMARLWRDQGKRDEARDLLAPVYGWFTEGFDTLDLKEAKKLLEELA